MVNSYEIDLRILFKKFYCPICGEKLKLIKDFNRLTEEQKKIYYKELYPHGVPIELDVNKVKQIFKCTKCNYYNTTDNQLIIHKKQKLLRNKIIGDSGDRGGAS